MLIAQDTKAAAGKAVKANAACLAGTHVAITPSGLFVAERIVNIHRGNRFSAGEE